MDFISLLGSIDIHCFPANDFIYTYTCMGITTFIRCGLWSPVVNCYQYWSCSTILWLILYWFNVIVNVIFLIASWACSFPGSVSMLYFLRKQNPRRSRALSSADHSCSGTAIKTKCSAKASHQSLSSNSSTNSTQYIPRNTLYITYINMNFNKIFVFVALILAISLGQSDAGWLKKIGKKIVSSLRNWRKYRVTNYIYIYIFIQTGTCWPTH